MWYTACAAVFRPEPGRARWAGEMVTGLQRGMLWLDSLPHLMGSLVPPDHNRTPVATGRDFRAGPSVSVRTFNRQPCVRVEVEASSGQVCA
jgi:hypothetical protein